MVTGRNKGPDPLEGEADHRPGLQLGDKSTKAFPQNGTMGGANFEELSSSEKSSGSWGHAPPVGLCAPKLSSSF